MIAAEENVGAESVTGAEQAVPENALQPKPIVPDSQDDLLKHKLNLANQHARKAEKEKQEMEARIAKMQSQIESMQEAQRSGQQKVLEDQGAFRDLYEQEKGRARKLEERLLNETADLKTQLESVTQSANQERLRAAAMSQISRSNAVNPQQLYVLLQGGLRMNDEGHPVLLNEGVEQPLGEYLSGLKQAPEWQHHFAASKQQGMGVMPGSGSVAPGRENPYRSGNLTEAIRLEVENPALAKALKAEARG